MAVSVTANKRLKFGNAFAVVADIAMDDSYPTGGEAVLAKQFGLAALDLVLGAPSGGYIPEYDHVNKKLMVYYGDNDGAADGPLVQVANKADLSAVTFRFMAIGY